MHDMIQPEGSVKPLEKIDFKKAYKIAFDRWFEKQQKYQNHALKSRLLRAMDKGFNAIEIDYNNPDLTDEDKRFMRTEYFIPVIKERIPDLDVKYKKDTESFIFGLSRSSEKLIIRVKNDESEEENNG